MNAQRCSRCGEEITDIYPYGNGIYGWTCITKVDPSQKGKRGRKKPRPIYPTIRDNINRNSDAYKSLLDGYALQVEAVFVDFEGREWRCEDRLHPGASTRYTVDIIAEGEDIILTKDAVFVRRSGADIKKLSQRPRTNPKASFQSKEAY